MAIGITLGIFALISISAKKVGQWFSGIGLPYITGYLLIGTLAGPFVFGLLPSSATTDLRFVDDISLAIIAFVAGSELYFKEIRKRLNAISAIAGSVILIAAPISGVALFFLTEFIPFAAGMSVTERIVVAILGGTILLALSPPSTIAVIKEVRAKGDFTRTLLGVTISMDVLIIVLFAVAVAISSALLTGAGFSLAFIGLLLLDLAIAIVAGLVVGKLIEGVMQVNMHNYVRILMVVLIGWGVFAGAKWLTASTKGTAIELHIEALLIALIAGFFITNFTSHRDRFEHLLHEISPVVYVAFFTLTGVGIKLDILAQTWPIAVALFAVRAIGIYLGGQIGSRAAGESNKFANYAGLALITQAGIALGLAREVAIAFPSLGDAFATMVISVIVINEVVGPMFLKGALKWMGEANLPNQHATGPHREVLILGIESQSLELERQLEKSHWTVTMADTDRDHVAMIDADNISVVAHHLHIIDEEEMRGLITDETDAVVVMLEDDTANLQALEIAYKAGVPRLIARPHDLSLADRYAELGALVIDPTSAMVNLLRQTVRAPQNAAILLGQDAGREVVQMTISNRDIDGLLLRELRLPNDVLILDVTRDGNVILPNGYTRLRLDDEVTVVGREPSLEEVTLKLGY